MSFRTLSVANAATSLGFGLVGLLVPSVLATVLGIELNGITVWVARRAATPNHGFAVLAGFSRDVAEAVATRAIAAANAVAWGLGAAVVAAALVAGFGEPRAWAFVVMQVAFAAAWSWTLARAPLAVRTA